MGIESSVTYISDLNYSVGPLGSDPKNLGDNHIRNIKLALGNTFPNVIGAVSASHIELSYAAGVSSSIQVQLNSKAPTASPTFTGTVTATGAVVDVTTQVSSDSSTKAASTAFVQAVAFNAALPAQAGNSGKVVTTDGANASWAAAADLALPAQTGNAGKALITNGTSASWSTVDLGLLLQAQGII